MDDLCRQHLSLTKYNVKIHVFLHLHKTINRKFVMTADRGSIFAIAPILEKIH